MSNQQAKPGSVLGSTISKLYNIRNVANLATYCPEKYVDVDILQDVFEHVSGMVQSLIEELEQEA